MHENTRLAVRQRGFTLIELLIVIAIAATLAGMAAPPLGLVADSIRMTGAANRLLAHLHVARSEAIKRRGRVALCKSPDGAICSATGDWDQGWIVFHDANNDGMHEWDEEVIAAEGRQPGRLHITANLGVARYVSYSPGGEARLVSGAFQAGTFTLCSESRGRTEARHVVVNSVGRARVEKGLLAGCA